MCNISLLMIKPCKRYLYVTNRHNTKNEVNIPQIKPSDILHKKSLSLKLIFSNLEWGEQL